MFAGIDHVDVRVASLAAVESFYDRFFPALGLSRKERSYVDAAGDCHTVGPAGETNVIEYYESDAPDARFIALIEDSGHVTTWTRLAFAVRTGAEIDAWETRLRETGAHEIERSDIDGYPALFFEDPARARLELCARSARRCDET